MKNILFAVLFAAAFTQISAQVSETAEPLLNQLSIWKPVTIEQLSIDLQNRNRGTALSDIIQAPTSAEGNISWIKQVGYENFVNLVQEGSGNINLVHQSGMNNTYNADIEGDNNLSAVLQGGTGNSVYQYVTIDNSQFLFVQLGHQNEIFQEETSGPARQYEVVQAGSGMTIYILNGTFR